MASPSEERRNWLELPREVTALIMSRLTAVETLTRAQLVCKAWLEVSKDPLVWNRIDMSNIGDPCSDLDFQKMCRNAVDRSCGQAVDVNIEDFGDDDLLKYISDRSSRIKRLRLACCDNVSDEGLVEAVKKLPLLEDLELTICSFATELYQAVGRLCPGLRSFKLNSQSYRLSNIHSDEEDDFNEDAVSIASSMPELRELQLIGNVMTNKGLRAILEGCPKLESLDLRGCLNVSTKGRVWERCTEQVRHLRLPRDSTAWDYMFRTDHLDDYVNGNDCFYPGFHGGFPSFCDFDSEGQVDDYNCPQSSACGDPFDYDDFTVPDSYF